MITLRIWWSLLHWRKFENFADKVDSKEQRLHPKYYILRNYWPWSKIDHHQIPYTTKFLLDKNFAKPTTFYIFFQNILRVPYYDNPCKKFWLFWAWPKTITIHNISKVYSMQYCKAGNGNRTWHYESSCTTWLYMYMLLSMHVVLVGE